MDRLTVVRSLTHPYPLHGTVYATTGIPEVDTKIEAIPRHPRQWPFIGSVVDYLADRRQGGALPEMPRNVALPVRDGVQERVPAAGRALRRDARDALRPGLHRLHPSGYEAGPRDPARSRVPRPVPRHQADRHPGAGRQRPARAADRRRTVRPPAVVAGAIRPGAPGAGTAGEAWSTFGHLQEAAFALLATGKLHDALDYTREPLACARSLRHDALRPVVPGRPAARRGRDEVRHGHLGRLRVERRLLGHAPQPLREAQGLPAARVRPGVLGA